MTWSSSSLLWLTEYLLVGQTGCMAEKGIVVVEKHIAYVSEHAVICLVPGGLENFNFILCQSLISDLFVTCDLP